AIALHHAAEHRRALSMLNEIEGPARSGPGAGDFLLPAIMAWTALISAVSGDHERADTHLSAIAESSASAAAAESNTIVDELVRPARCIASALRALDRLDLDSAGLALAAMAAFPE